MSARKLSLRRREPIMEITARGRGRVREGRQTHMGIEDIIIGGRDSNGSTSSSSSRSISSSRVTSKTSLSDGQVMLELDHLPLQQSYGSNASVNRVLEPGLCFVSQGIHRVLPLLLRDLNEDLAHIAGSEHLVDFGEFLALVGTEVRGEYTVGGASSLQELAGCT